MTKDFFFREENKEANKQTNKQNNNNKKQTNKEKNKRKNKFKKWGTGAVQDKSFDELLMFIVGKDSALFSGLWKWEVACPSSSNVQAPLSVCLSFGEYPLVRV